MTTSGQPRSAAAIRARGVAVGWPPSAYFDRRLRDFVSPRASPRVGIWSSGERSALRAHCRDCGTTIGEIHKLGCGIEQCPRCRRQYMSCSCESSEDVPDSQELRAAHCWERTDRVPDDPVMTVFRRRARLSQAKWREKHDFPIGHQPIAGGPGSRELGSRIELNNARETGANLITRLARKAARDRRDPWTGSAPAA